MRNVRPRQLDQMMRPMRQRLAQEVHIDAPIGGWNTRESIDNMPPTDAVILDNWIPDLGSVNARPGYGLYCDVGQSEDIETLVVFDSGVTKRFLAFHGDSCTDITNPSSPVTVSAIGVVADARWQSAQFDGKICVVNGANETFKGIPDGLGGITWTGMDITGPVENDIIGVNVFKNRTWFWEKNSQDVWYSALNTMGGTLTEFPLSRVGQFGGNLVTMETWTRDGGSGPDDFAVFIMSSGEAIIYQGSSPATGGDWAIVGVYRIGAPLSQRAAVKFGPDLFMITDLDYVNLSEVLAGIEAKKTRTKANGALRLEISRNRDQWGWEAIVWPERRLIIFNIPQGGGVYYQHVFNYMTGAWCRFTGIDSHTWCVYDNDMYFGASGGKIYKLDSAYKADKVGLTGVDDTGDAIQTAMQPAWTNFGVSQRKTFVGIRKFISTNTDIKGTSTYATDFKPFRSQDVPAVVDEVGTPWGSPWGSPWSASDKILSDWSVIHGYGTVASFRDYRRLKQRTKYLGTTWLFKIGERL